MEVYTEQYVQWLYDLLEPLKEVVQDDTWHPEGNAWIHSFQVVSHAMHETDDTDLIIAALMHDVGKSVHNLGHDKESVSICENLLSVKSLWLVSQHMRFWDMVNGDMKRHGKVTALLKHPWLPQLVALCRWDKMGRRANYQSDWSVERLAVELNEKANRHFRRKPDGTRCDTQDKE
jgi:hypothetical protein